MTPLVASVALAATLFVPATQPGSPPHIGMGTPHCATASQNPPQNGHINGTPRHTWMRESTFLQCGVPPYWRHGFDVLNLWMPNDPGSFNRCINYGGAFYPGLDFDGQCLHVPT